MIKKKILLLILFLSSICYGLTLNINTFFGEVDPHLEGRTDLQQYYSGCRTLENFIVLKYGGVTKRPGSKYIAEVNDSDCITKLAPFEFSIQQAYILEFGNEYIRFYKDGGQILDGNDPYYIGTSYQTADLFELQYVQSADTMYIVHPNYAPRKLTRTGHTSWTLSEADFQRGPFLDENITSITITPSGYTIDDVNDSNDTFILSGDGDLSSIFTANKNFTVAGSTGNDATWIVESIIYSDPNFAITVTGNITDSTVDGEIIIVDGAITLTASSDIFNSNHVGALWQVTHTVEAENVEGSFTGTGNSAPVTVHLDRGFDFSTHGTWAGSVFLQKSYDGGITWKDVLPVHYESDGNVQYSESENVADAIYRIRMSSYTSGTCKYNLVARSFDVDGVVEITSYTSTKIVSGIIQYALGDISATKYWSEGAWSADEGYPSVVAFYEERLAFAATINKPQTVWLSQTDDWENFRAGGQDTDALKYTIAADQVNAIRWMVSHNALLIGTSGGEWKLSASSSDEPLTSDNRTCKRQSSNGSAYLQAIPINNVILFVQRQGKKVRELTYSFESDTWIAPDLTVLSEHITESGITQMALQKAPELILWCVTANGDLIGMTYNREQEVVAWHKQTFSGDVESVAVIPGDGEDEIWIIVNRTIDGSTKRYIEQIQPRDWGSDPKDIFFVDSGLTFDGGPAVNISAISRSNPIVVKVSSWPVNGDNEDIEDGDQIRITDVSGMTEVNNNVYTVSNPNKSALTFELKDKTDTVDITSVNFSIYVSGGSIEKVENNFTTLGHLEDKTASITADGGYYGTKTVDSNTITLSDYYNTVHTGLSYTSKVLPQRVEVAGKGTEKRVKRITNVTLRLYETLGCSIGTSWDDYDSLYFRYIDAPLNFATPLFSGDKEIDFEGDYQTAGNIYVQNTLPVPCTILCIMPEFEVYK